MSTQSVRLADVAQRAGTSTKTATVEANDKDHAYRMLMADGNVGPFMDWEEDFDVEYDTSPQYYIKETV